MNNRIFAILAALLFLLLLGVGFWAFNLNSEKQNLISKNANLTSEVESMEALKAKLETEVDSLEAAYNTLYDENETLQGALADEKARVKRRERKIRSLNDELEGTKLQSNSQMSDLRTQIESLLASKSALENEINSLRTENESLKTQNADLQQNLGKAREDNLALANLNRSMEGELDRLTLANFKATAFNVEFLKRNSKVTSKSRRARKIKVSFDLTGVPQEYQGVRPLYLVITDEKSTPIKLENPISAQVVVNGQQQDILAAQAKEVNVQKSQRISFSHQLDDKLKSGYYRLSVYTNIGLLGATSFRLR